ncbi:hypothetical protein F2Q70_00010344 [Brassica cretica]|uniref:Uncharacterized protein n=1 Tax=Brassica cretica TaxID=69181 RepID=A0A8S9MD21_BRACR|nr:hypothetical protein F2Q70_00010344 [Brassica cretica]
MELLETFGCIWSSEEVIRIIFGRALPGATSRSDYMKSLYTTSQSDFPRATARSRSRFHVRRHTILIPGATSQNDVLKSLPMFRATCWSNTPRSLASSRPETPKSSILERSLRATYQGRSQPERPARATSSSRSRFDGARHEETRRERPPGSDYARSLRVFCLDDFYVISEAFWSFVLLFCMA